MRIDERLEAAAELVRKSCYLFHDLEGKE